MDTEKEEKERVREGDRRKISEESRGHKRKPRNVREGSLEKDLGGQV